MKTISRLLLLSCVLSGMACTKPEKVSTALIPRTPENTAVFEVDAWNAQPETKVKSADEKNTYNVSHIKYRAKTQATTKAGAAGTGKSETIERTRIDDYWSAYLLLTESGQTNDHPHGVVKAHAKMKSILVFTLDSTMLTADMEALINKERSKGVGNTI